MSFRFAFDSHGVKITVDLDGPADNELVDTVEAILPPGHRPIPLLTRPDASLRLSSDGGRLTVHGAGGQRQVCADETDAVHTLDREIRAVVSLLAPDRVFVHAGVVAGAHGACVIPGSSFAGKTTLVRALIEAGATYLSDEYAVLYRTGAVAPYARALSIRSAAGRHDIAPAKLGQVAGPGPIPVALVVSTAYEPAGTWDPTAGSAGDCALALVANAVAARTRPGEVLAAAAAAAARHARFLHGARGDASETAAAIVDLLGGPARPAEMSRTAGPGACSTPAPHRAPTTEGHP